MAPWETDTEMGSSGSGSVNECTPTSVPGDVDTQAPQKMDFRQWKQEFFNRLGDIKTFGDFACMTRYSHHVNPGLEVAGSLIPLPLVSRDADEIKTKCEQAPFGRGDDTVVDVSVRKTWQLDASLFRCSNPAWAAFLDTVLCEAVQKLGMPKGTRAVPWKLLFYEEGSFFRPHKDSEKAPGMIGTLVISLPSKHEGGEVHLSHSNRRHAFATSDYSSFDLTALAWYSDVTHEIKPLSSGYRLVITYNLLQQRGSPPSAGVFVDQQVQLQALLQTWASALQSKTRVIYRLDHKYSQSSLSIQNMKGRDAQRIRCLKQACQEAGFYIFLATMTRTEGCEDEYYGGDDEESLQLDYVTSLDGNKITESVDFDIKEILGPDPYKNRDPDSEDEGEFTGNESMPSQYRYHDSVSPFGASHRFKIKSILSRPLTHQQALLIVPRRGLIDLAKSPSCSAANLFRMVYDSAAASPGAPPTRLEALGLFGCLLDNFGTRIGEGRLLSMVLRASKLWSSKELYNKAMRRALLEAQRKTNHYFSHQSLMASSTRSRTAAISDAVAEFANEFFTHPTDEDWNECLGEVVQSLDNLTSLNTALQNVEERLQNEEIKQSFRCWRIPVETSKFETKDILTSLDLPLILSLIQSHSADDEWVSTQLLPKLSQRAEKQLLYPLFKHLCAENEHSALQLPGSLARRLLDATLSKLNLEIDDLEPKPQNPPQSSISFLGGSNGTDGTVNQVTGFENLLEHCFACLLAEQGMALLKNTYEHLSEAIGRLPPRGPERENTMDMWPYGKPTTATRGPAESFLVFLISIFHTHPLLDPPPFVRDLFVLLFTRHILPDQPKNPPQRSRGWSHKPRFCYRHNPSRDKIHGTCHECALMQDFILSPDQRQGRFSYGKSIRSHLESALPSEHYRCETDTTRAPGGCHTLVVTKIGKDTEFKEEMGKFNAKVRNYEQRLLPFRKPAVQRILGDETYKSLIMLETTPSATSSVPVSNKRAAGESAGQPASTRQRMDDVIDLTGE